jgi:hypothetical protein
MAAWYGVYYDTSVYQTIAQQMAQQASDDAFEVLKSSDE